MQADAMMDLRGVPCPTNTARALVKIAMMSAGETLELWLDDGEPIVNVPSSLEMGGHEVVAKRREPGGHWLLMVRLGE